MKFGSTDFQEELVSGATDLIRRPRKAGKETHFSSTCSKSLIQNHLVQAPFVSYLASANNANPIFSKDVVRAVASLLHYLRALTSAGTPAFEKDYEDALKMYRKLQRQSKLVQAGQIHSYMYDMLLIKCFPCYSANNLARSASTREAPKIRFLGALDTVKAVNDQSLHEISFNRSIQHLRHALALNEDRQAFTPEYIYPDYNQVSLLNRSIIQAWFVGAHIDVGGSAAKDGLALYPLQWMLLESQAKGLALEFDGSFGGRVYIDNPLDVVFPPTEQLGKDHDLWYCKAENGMKIGMQDLRAVHKLEKYAGRYAIHLNRRRHPFMRKKARRPFSADGTLEGYCGYGMIHFVNACDSC